MHKNINNQTEGSFYRLPFLLYLVMENNLSEFTKEELTIGHGLTTITQLPFCAPLRNGKGACLVRIQEIKREKGIMQFYVVNVHPPVNKWVKAKDFFDEWPE